MNGYISYIREKLDNQFDVKYRVIDSELGEIQAVFVDNLCDSKFISEYIISPIVRNKDMKKSIDYIKTEVLSANSIGNIKTKEEAIMHILSGDVVLVFEFLEEVIYCEAKGFSKRAITIPITEAVLKGPREGFNEVFVDNISLIRRKIKNSNLKFESFYIGEQSNTVVVMTYINGLAPKELVNSVRRKLSSIKLGFVLDTNYIAEQFKSKKTFFDTIGYSEKPDIVASKICQGKVGIIVDGTPFVITMPYFFIENFQMPDDYYVNKKYSNITRLLRYICFGISLLLPGLYLALSTYHFSLIPTVFVFRVAVSRAGVPFPTVIEVLLMMFFFQILREAGIRLPQPIGQSMSIVGALILGDAAVGAGLASQVTLIVIALSSICSFLAPKLYSPVSFWSVIIVLFSSALGLPGFYIGFLVFVSHMAGLKSCEYLYLFPVGTEKTFKFKDTLTRDNLSDVSENSIIKGDKQ